MPKLSSLFTASKTMRLFLFNLSLIILLGIWLTGFAQVHWLLLLIPAFLMFSALSGFCVGLLIPRLIFRRENNMTAE